MSLNSQSIVSKWASFALLLEEHNADIVILSETWLSPDVYNNEFFPNKFHVFRKDRADGYGRILLACRDSITCQELTFDTNSEAVVCQATLSRHQSVIICSFYRPPNNNIRSVKDLCDLFTNIITKYPNIPIWLADDLNLSNIDWENTCTQGSTYPLALCDTIIDFLQGYGFTQVVNFPTNILDVFMTNRPSSIHRCVPIAGISDHEAIFFESSVTFSQHQCIRRRFYLWHKADNSSINKTITQFTTSFLNKFSISTSIDI